MVCLARRPRKSSRRRMATTIRSEIFLAVRSLFRRSACARSAGVLPCGFRPVAASRTSSHLPQVTTSCEEESGVGGVYHVGAWVEGSQASEGGAGCFVVSAQRRVYTYSEGSKVTGLVETAIQAREPRSEIWFGSPPNALVSWKLCLCF